MSMLSPILLAACSLGSPVPVITGISPTKGWTGDVTDVEIEGRRFYPDVVVDGADADETRIDGAFRAWLETDPPTPLEGVFHAGYDTLRAEVPAGLPLGTWDLRVESPSGREDTLEDAFTVTPTRADHLVFDVETAGYEVGEYATVVIRLEGPDDEPVAQALEVEILAASTTGATGVSFLAGGLDEQVMLDDGSIGVRGFLGADGDGVVLLTSDVEDDVQITATSTSNPEVDDPDALILSWDPGAIADIDITLPRDDFVAEAGRPFEVDLALRDAFGNLLELETANIFLFEECGTWHEPVTITGTRTVEVTLTEACSANQLLAGSQTDQWTSESFDVLPAEPSAYDVVASPPTVVAGDNGLFLLVTAVDPYGNTVEGHQAELSLSDDVGGLDPSLGVGYAWCPGFEETGPSEQRCTVGLWAAQSAVVVTATDAQGLTGSALPVNVLPGEPASVFFTVSDASVVAGEPFEVLVRVVDAYGNEVEFDPAGDDPVIFSDDTGTIECDWTGPLGDQQTFECAIEYAGVGVGLGVSVLSLEATLEGMDIVNAELASVEVAPQGAAFTAGDGFTLDLVGYDAYGNPYVEQTDPVLDLADTTGSLSPVQATLDADGTAAVSATLTIAAADVVITASQRGSALGSSRALAVLASTMAGFEVEAPPWIGLGDAASVDVRAVDAWANPILGYAGPATLESRGERCDAVTLTAFADGAATARVECHTAGFADTLEISDEEGRSGTSDSVDIVDFACADGPTAELELDGGDSATACLVAGSAAVDVDSSGSVAGGAAIVVHQFVDGGLNDERSLAGSASFDYDEPGTHVVEALVLDTRACGSVASGYLYVGEDDGSPAGPVSVAFGGSSVATGSSTTVDLAAEDCAGDVASGEELLVRADLGTLAGTSTGAGLAVTLDASGTASTTWTFDAGYAGTASFWAGSEDGGAFGTGSVEVTPDQRLPQVRSMSPAGTTTEVVTSIEVSFDEAMLASNLTAGNFTLTGPSGVVGTTVTYAADLMSVSIAPDGGADGAEGEWTLEISRNVRDAAENRLDGEWTGLSASFVGIFGDVPNEIPLMTSCPSDTSRFFPDGDAGSGEEVDELTVTPVVSSAPTWWVVEVHDASGERTRTLRADGALTGITWDGRGDDGRVVASGNYSVSIDALDAQGNSTQACTLGVEVAQHVESP